jgi:hypothetical protein
MKIAARAKEKASVERGEERKSEKMTLRGSPRRTLPFILCIPLHAPRLQLKAVLGAGNSHVTKVCQETGCNIAVLPEFCRDERLFVVQGWADPTVEPDSLPAQIALMALAEKLQAREKGMLL